MKIFVILSMISAGIAQGNPLRHTSLPFEFEETFAQHQQDQKLKHIKIGAAVFATLATYFIVKKINSLMGKRFTPTATLQQELATHKHGLETIKKELEKQGYLEDQESLLTAARIFGNQLNNHTVPLHALVHSLSSMIHESVATMETLESRQQLDIQSVTSLATTISFLRIIIERISFSAEFAAEARYQYLIGESSPAN